MTQTSNMNRRRRVLGIIPARGGSKRLPGKNVRMLAGRPLLAYSILTATSCRMIDRVVVSSDDPVILQTAREWGAEGLLRPEAISGDTAPTIAAMRHAVESLAARGETFDDIALFQATCPLRHLADVENAIKSFQDSDVDSVLSVNELHLKVGRAGPGGIFVPQYKVGIRKQDLPPVYQENGAFYLTRRPLIERSVLLGPRTMMLHLPREAGLASIDDEFDFEITEALYHRLGYEKEFGPLSARMPRLAG